MITGMSDRRIVRHLVVAVLIKLIALAALWGLFVRDARVAVDADRVGDRVAGTAAPAVGHAADTGSR